MSPTYVINVYHRISRVWSFYLSPSCQYINFLSLEPIMISLYCKQEQWKEPLTLWQLTESRWVFFALSHLLVTETENLEVQIPKPCKQFHLRQTFTSNYGIFVYYITLTRCQTEEYKYWFYLIRFGARKSVCNSHNQFR